MITVEKLLFPGIGLGCLFLVLATSFITKPHVAKASNIESQSRSAVQSLPTATAIYDLASGQAAQEQTGMGEVQPAAEEQQEATPEPVVEEQVVEQVVVEQAGEEQSYQEAEDCSLGGGFPDSVRQWCEFIDRYATEHGLDPNLVAAVMVQESGGNPEAYSKDGAVGLLQVMPRDGIAAGFQCINGPCFANRPSSSELFDPEYNVEYGTRMLAGLIQKKGDVREALRAYGPMNMGYIYADKVLAIMNRNR